MKFVARITIPFEAENTEESEQLIMSYVRDGIKDNCTVEMMQLPNAEEIKQQEQLSFKELLNNLNSGDMTKN